MRSGWATRYPRPRLSDAVSPRRHWVDGHPHVVLHAAGGDAAVIGEREWAFIAAADGTRDIAGIRIAAGRDGRLASEERLSAFFEQLADAGMLDTGVPAEESSPVPHEGARTARPLAGFRLACDGSGTCCRLYPTTTFLPLDVVRARRACPEILEGGQQPERAWTPMRSSASPTWDARAVAMVNGRCAFLGADDLCQIHARAGANEKPRGCRSFPARVVDDGTELVVGPRPQCRCVFTSPPTDDRLAAAPVDTHVVVDVLPDVVEVGADITWPRARYLAWARGLRWSLDGADALWQLAAAIERPPSDPAAMVRGWVDRIARHNHRQGWRSAGDMARLIPEWMERAARRERPGAPLPGEALYLQAISHVHAWLFDELPLAASLRARAVRLHVARGIAAEIEGAEMLQNDPAWTEPIALVEACSDAFGLGPNGDEVAI